jgi:hypothetical protein
MFFQIESKFLAYSRGTEREGRGGVEKRHSSDYVEIMIG